VDGRILGIIELSDVLKPGIRDRIQQLRQIGIRTVMVTGDNPVTAGAIAAEAGVDSFVAEAKPEDKLRLIQHEQAQGRLVAMTGDGTNDAPALAQADVGLAMHSGTMPAKEAANLIDLDSDPTELIDLVAIGKQMLITRGAVTTFSIANDVAKYFAIIPGMFIVALPGLSALNVMDLASQHSAVLSALIFNALIIPALIPLALRGVRFRPINAEASFYRNLMVYGVGGLIAPFVGIKVMDLVLGGYCEPPNALILLAPAMRFSVITPQLCGLAYPLALTGLAQWLMPGKANGSLLRSLDGTVIGSRLIGQNWDGPEWFHGRPSATIQCEAPGQPYRPREAFAAGGRHRPRGFAHQGAPARDIRRTEAERAAAQSRLAEARKWAKNG
jgi:soluble P-type ATPase